MSWGVKAAAVGVLGIAACCGCIAVYEALRAGGSILRPSHAFGAIYMTLAAVASTGYTAWSVITNRTSRNDDWESASARSRVDLYEDPGRARQKKIKMFVFFLLLILIPVLTVYFTSTPRHG